MALCTVSSSLLQQLGCTMISIENNLNLKMSNTVGLLSIAKIHIKQDCISILKLKKFLDKKTEGKV